VSNTTARRSCRLCRSDEHPLNPRLVPKGLFVQLFKELLTVLLRMLNQRRLLWCYLGCGAGYPHPVPIILPAPRGRSETGGLGKTTKGAGEQR
jgi:hypothetical protein